MLLRRPAHPALLLALVLVALLSPAALQAGSLPAWDRKIDSPGRFKVLAAFDGLAVLDKETGLVWTKAATNTGTFRASLRHCALREIGGRLGWRMPATEELLTLVDPTQTTPALPPGAPFENVLGVRFWTANEDESDPTTAVTVSLDVFALFTDAKTQGRKVLCVRGGRGSTTAARGGL